MVGRTVTQAHRSRGSLRQLKSPFAAEQPTVHCFLDALDLSLLSSARITLHSSMHLGLDHADKLIQRHILRNKLWGLASGRGRTDSSWRSVEVTTLKISEDGHELEEPHDRSSPSIADIFIGSMCSITRTGTEIGNPQRKCNLNGSSSCFLEERRRTVKWTLMAEG